VGPIGNGMVARFDGCGHGLVGTIGERRRGAIELVTVTNCVGGVAGAAV
jgi:hypothetical protein